MKKLLVLLVFVGSLLAACGGSGKNTDNTDSIDAVNSADSLLQNQLNADTTMNTENSLDNLQTDSMQGGNSQ